MGLTAESTGRRVMCEDIPTREFMSDGADFIIALAGNPNVGKSTVFNALTGLNQHTGNWPGKTVASAQGKFRHRHHEFVLVDLPGTYSLIPHSPEEEVTRDYLCCGSPDAVVVICDATCLERNLPLVLQAMEITDRVIVCVNLMDEALRKGIRVDTERLAVLLGVPVIPTNARKHKSLHTLMDAIADMALGRTVTTPAKIDYPTAVEHAMESLEPVIAPLLPTRIHPRFAAKQLLIPDNPFCQFFDIDLNGCIWEHADVRPVLTKVLKDLEQAGIPPKRLMDYFCSCAILHAEGISSEVLSGNRCGYSRQDRRVDRFLTGKWTGIPTMVVLLAVILWITIVGANYPSDLLSQGFHWLGERITDGLTAIHAPDWLTRVLMEGVYRVLTWVIAVMLPPMALFFPLFTLLEDVGYLPRVAFNLDKSFQKVHACGKQGLTMCMGLGCNAAGVVGCRIIDSPRERLIATITNNFIPCNGRFPMLIAIISMFFVGFSGDVWSSFGAVALLTGAILFSVLMTFWVSRFLSATVLKGMPSSFSMELPPYRTPQVGRVIIRSIFDRTLFVLARATAVAAPAGLLIWLLANIAVGDTSLLTHCAQILDPLGQLMGLDGVILLAFILGFPANEIVVPLIIMTYMSTGSIHEIQDLNQLRTILTDNGWTWLTALCTILFSLMHWPCSTTCLTIRKETNSWKWTILSFLVPTVIGIVLCAAVAALARLTGSV